MAKDYRHEYKYICSVADEQLLESRLKTLMTPDSHTGIDGTYLIRSIYFDDPENTCFYENENGIDPRAKFRLRIYNLDPGFIRLEKKYKDHGMTRKESCRISVREAGMFMSGIIPDPAPGDNIKAAMLTEMKMKLMRPVVIVQYTRRPYTDLKGNVRVTFDKFISSSEAFDKFFDRDMPARHILPQGSFVLEVKWDEFLPSYLYDCMGLENMQWSGFSKYYLCRKYNLTGGLLL